MANSAEMERNKKVAVDFLETVFIRHEIDEGIARCLGVTYKQHNAEAPDGKEGLRAHFKAVFKRLPTATVVIKRVFADGDFVLVHINWKDRPTDRGSAVVDIYRLENGRLVEHWDVVQPIPATLPHDNTMLQGPQKEQKPPGGGF